MYEDLSQIERMVSMYLVLDKDDQTKIQEKVIELHLKSVHKKAVFKEQSQVPLKQRLSDNEIEAEINARTIERLKQGKAMADAIDNFSPDQKAALLITMISLEKRFSIPQEPTVHITVSHRPVSAKKIIEESLPEADYGNARKIYREMIGKIEDRCG